MAFSTVTSSKAVKKNAGSPPTSHDDLIFNQCNHVARFEVDPSHSEFAPVSLFLKKSPLQYAFTENPRMSKMLIGNFWLTCMYDEKSKEIKASILTDPTTPDLTFGVEDVRSALQLPSYSSYDTFPLGTEHDEVIEALNYIHADNERSPGTLLRKNMGGIWNFFFSHVILCLSRKTGGHDQSPSYITQLAHALIFQRKIDFAEYFFQELVNVITPPKRPNVAYPRFISLIIHSKLAVALDTDHRSASPRVTYDHSAPIVSKPILNRAPLDTDHPLLPGMVSFINSSDLQWGDARDTPLSKVPSSVVAAPSAPSQVKPASKKKSSKASKKKSSKASGTFTLASMTIRSKKPSVVVQVTHPSPKRRHSPSSPPSPLKRLKKISRAKPPTPPTDSPQSTGVGIFLSETGDSAKLKTISFVSSQKDTIVKSGTPHIPSSTFSLMDEDDLDISPVQDATLSLHGLSPDPLQVVDVAQPGEGLVVPKDGPEGFPSFLNYLSQGRDQEETLAGPSPQSAAFPRRRSPPKSASQFYGSSSGYSLHGETDDSSPSPPPSPTDAILCRRSVTSDAPSRILPHHPPTPTHVKVSVPHTRDSASSAPAPVFPADLLEDIRDANRQHRMVGSQFEALKGALDRFIAQTLQQLQSLQDSNAHLTLSVASLKAASDARDDEVRRLQASSQVQQDINSQILQSLQSLHQKVDTLKVASPPAAEGEKQRIQHSSASCRQTPSSAPADLQARVNLSADVKSAMADHNTSAMVDASSLRSEGEKNEGTGVLTRGKTRKFL